MFIWDYNKAKTYRDVFWEGTCDDGCQKLADLLGWGDELREMVKREWARIDAEAKASNNSKGDESEPGAAAKV